MSFDAKTYQRAWRAANREKTAEYSRGYRKRNIDKVRERNRLAMKKRHEADPEKVRASHRKWHRDNPEKSRAKAIRCHLATFGLTLESWTAMLDAQGGVCAICGGVERRGHALSVDHCHATNRVRGLLCGDCNRGLGMYRDRDDLLLRAAEYLRQ